jgi:hypothetical protein
MINYYNEKCIENSKMNKIVGKVRVEIIKHDTKYGPY